MNPTSRKIQNIKPEASFEEIPVSFQPHTQKRTSKKVKFFMYVISLFVLWWVISFVNNSNSWKAVFIDNNQVFFGKFIYVPFADTITLRDVYYIKSDTTMSSSTVIVPLSDMVHAPKNEMTIMKNRVLFYENLQLSSPITRALNNKKVE